MTVPTQTALTVPPTGLGAALGAGLQQGAQLGLQGLLQSYLQAQKAQQGLTAYQQLSTKLRAQEQLQKTERGITNTLLKLAEEGIIDEQDVIPISRQSSDLVRRGINPSIALDHGVSNFQFQKDALDDLKIEKYNKRKAESLKENIIKSLQEENITNSTLINRKLKEMKWPVKERQDIVKGLRGFGKTIEMEKMPSPIGNKGRIIKDTNTGKRYRSDGTKWTEIK